MIVLLFTKNASPYKAGDTASFPNEEEAEKWLDAGVAEEYDESKIKGTRPQEQGLDMDDVRENAPESQEGQEANEGEDTEEKGVDSAPVNKMVNRPRNKK